MPTPPPAPPARQSGCGGVLLAVLIGVLLPAVLLAFHAGQNAVTYRPPATTGSFFASNVANLISLGSVFAAPGALLLGWLLSVFLSRRLHRKLVTRTEHFWTGVLLGALFSYANLPAYPVVYLFRNIENPVLLFLRIALLFAVTGAACGLCIAWQLWLAYNPTEKVRFSLGTLLLLLLAGAATVAAFLPLPAGLLPPRP